MRNRFFLVFMILALGVFLYFIFASVFGGLFIDQEVAIRALETQGFSDIRIVDRDWFAVSRKGGAFDDSVRFVAIATNPAGKRVEVYVFAGWPYKGATIRTPLTPE